MLTSKQLVECCKQVYAAKWVYWYGTYGKPCSESLYTSKRKQYPSHYTASRAAGYQRDIAEKKWCADCVGMIKYFFWSGGKFGELPKYATNNCPDVSANGMIKLCKETGAISTIPDIPGLVVWKDGHIGVYIGDGYTIEMRGFDYDCVKRRVKDGPWTKWGRLPASMITYMDAPAPSEKPNDLNIGSKGAAVKELQDDLIALGYKLPKYGADGDFGSETQAAVRSFQLDHNITPSGVADAATMAAIETALENNNATYPTIQHVIITGNTVNVRSAPGTDSRVLGVVRKGDQLVYQDDERLVDGRPWHLVIYNGENGWVSSKYSKLG